MRTLSKEKAADGIGGMVRHAIITDRKLYIFADEDIDSMCALDKEILINAIYGLL